MCRWQVQELEAEELETLWQLWQGPLRQRRLEQVQIVLAWQVPRQLWTGELRWLYRRKNHRQELG